MAECPFCQIVAGKASARVVYEDEHTLAFLDAHPISRGHSLVIPKKHVEWFTDMEPQDGIAGPFLKACYVVARKVRRAYDCEYVTLLIRGTRVPHLHMLVIPTVEGEENLLDRTLALHHFAQLHMKPQFTDEELDLIRERILDAKP
ncbi:HIT family protein [candidate division WOR-3 bacterium]|nr:HIT family protein [candidate division WOR-3 bacterium]